jgi:Dolichyl-phosphate-mannose-protein mannosyltransferase
MSSRSADRYLIFALIAAAALRLGALSVPIDPFAAPDSESFVLLSQSIVHEGRMAYRDPGSPAIELRAFRSLFYPLFLAASECVHAGTAGALIVQALLGIAVVACMFLVARRLLGDEIAAVTAWIGALYFGSIFYERQVLTEALYTPILVIGLTLAIVAFGRREGRGRKDYLLATGAGLVFGIAAITRPVGLIAAVLVTLVVAAAALRLHSTDRRDALYLAAAFASVTAVVVGSAMLRNFMVLGRFTLSTSGGMNLWMDNVGSIDAAWKIMAAELAERGEVGMDRWFYADTWAQRGQILAALPELLVRKCLGLLDPMSRDLTALPHRLILPFALAGVLLARPKDWGLWAVTAAVFLAHVGLALVFVANARYRSPIDPITWMLAAAAIAWLWRRGSAGRWTIFIIAGLNLAVRLFVQR